MDAGSLGAMIFMGVILKIPIAAAVWLLWSAMKAEPDVVEGPSDGGSHDRPEFRREPKRPRDPRRGGPHAPDALPLPCPEEGELRPQRARKTPARAPARSR